MKRSTVKRIVAVVVVGILTGLLAGCHSSSAPSIAQRVRAEGGTQNLFPATTIAVAASENATPVFCADAQQVYTGLENVIAGGDLTDSQAAAAKGMRVEAAVVGGQLDAEFLNFRQDLGNGNYSAAADDVSQILGQCYN